MKGSRKNHWEVLEGPVSKLRSQANEVEGYLGEQYGVTLVINSNGDFVTPNGKVVASKGASPRRAVRRDPITSGKDKKTGQKPPSNSPSF